MTFILGLEDAWLQCQSAELPLPGARPDSNTFQGEAYAMLTIKPHRRRVHREKLNPSLSLSLSLSPSSSHADLLIPLMTVRLLSGGQWWPSGCCRPFRAVPGTWLCSIARFAAISVTGHSFLFFLASVQFVFIYFSRATFGCSQHVLC